MQLIAVIWQSSSSSLSAIPELDHTPKLHHIATTPVSVEDAGSNTSAGPSWECVPSETPWHGQGLQDNSAVRRNIFLHSYRAIAIILQSSSSGTSSSFTSRVPSAQHCPSLPPIPEVVHTPESHYIATTPAEQISVEDTDSSTSTIRSQERVPSRTPMHGQGLQDSSAEDTFCPNENILSTASREINKHQNVSRRDWQRKSELEAAEERRQRRKESELEYQRTKVWVGASLRIVLY
jgi:hypothetical protein